MVQELVLAFSWVEYGPGDPGAGTFPLLSGAKSWGLYLCALGILELLYAH